MSLINEFEFEKLETVRVNIPQRGTALVEGSIEVQSIPANRGGKGKKTIKVEFGKFVIYGMDS